MNFMMLSNFDSCWCSRSLKLNWMIYWMCMQQLSGSSQVWRSSSTFLNNTSQWPFIRLSPYTSIFFQLRTSLIYMPSSLAIWPATCLRFNSSRLLVRDCQEDVEIGKFRNLILSTDRNCPWGENSCDINICHLEHEKNDHSPAIKTLIYCLMDSFRRIY